MNNTVTVCCPDCAIRKSFEQTHDTDEKCERFIRSHFRCETPHFSIHVKHSA